MDARVSELIEGHRAMKYVNYLGVSGFAFLLADFLYTFPDEVRLMWPSPRSLPKLLFFLVRYFVLVDAVFALLYGLPTGMSHDECLSAFFRIGISSKFVVMGSEAILLIRVYAFSGKNKPLLIFLLLQFVATHVSAFTLFGKFLDSVKFRNPAESFPELKLHCLPIKGENRFLGACFTVVLGSLFVVMISMVTIAYRKYRDFKNSLLTVFFRDGIAYFVCMSVLAASNAIVNFVADSRLKLLLVQTEVYLHAVLSTRMLLQLRATAEFERRLRILHQLEAGAVSTRQLDVYDYSFSTSRAMGMGSENTYDIFDFASVSRLSGTFGTGATTSHMSRGRQSYYGGLGGFRAGTGGGTVGEIQTVPRDSEQTKDRGHFPEQIEHGTLKSGWRDSAFGVPTTSWREARTRT